MYIYINIYLGKKISVTNVDQDLLTPAGNAGCSHDTNSTRCNRLRHLSWRREILTGRPKYLCLSTQA